MKYRFAQGMLCARDYPLKIERSYGVQDWGSHYYPSVYSIDKLKANFFGSCNTAVSS